MANPPKIVDTPHYHLWTDVLHARALAHQARNKWDRGTYVRWCVTTACIALEVACQDATGDEKISYRFEDNLDASLSSRDLPPLDWGRGTWQEVSQLRKRRNDYVHRFPKEGDLFPEAKVADDSVKTVREAIVSIYEHTNQPVPPWVSDDQDRGWDTEPGTCANAIVIRSGADEQDPRTLYICYVANGEEKVSDVLPPDTDPRPFCEEVLQSAQVPIQAIRVYEGDEVICEQEVRMRGT